MKSGADNQVEQRPVIVVDFAGMESGVDVAGIVSSLYPGSRVHAVDVLRLLGQTGDIPSLDRAARRLIDDHPEPATGQPVIIGYCSASSLAAHVAAVLETDGRAVDRLILIRPSLPDIDMIERNYQEILDRLTSGPTPSATLPWAQHPAEALETAVAEVTGRVTTNLREQGLDADELEIFASQLVNRYRAWLSLLSISMTSNLPPVKAPVVYIVDPSWSPRRLAGGPDAAVARLDTGFPDALSTVEFRQMLRRLCDDDLTRQG